MAATSSWSLVKPIAGVDFAQEPSSRSSTATMFQRSVVGAVSLTVTVVPDAGMGSFVYWF